MGVVVRAKIQTVEDMYRLIRSAVTARRPISAIYEQLPRLVCPHRLGRNSAGKARVALSTAAIVRPGWNR